MTQVDGVPIPRARGESPTRSPQTASPTNAIASPPQGGRLTVRLNNGPSSLSPYFDGSMARTLIMHQVAEPLLRRSADTLTFEPLLARSWRIDDTVLVADRTPAFERLAIADGSAVRSGAVTASRSELRVTVRPPAPTPLTASWVRLRLIGVADAPVLERRVRGEAEAVFRELRVGARYQLTFGAELTGEVRHTPEGLAVTTIEGPTHLLATGDVVAHLPQTALTFALDPRARWSDGYPFTSSDIAFTCDALHDPEVPGAVPKALYRDLSACDALDPHRIRLVFARRHFRMLELGARLGTLVLPRHLLGADVTRGSQHGAELAATLRASPHFSERPLGTGPYVIEAHERGQRVVLRRNDYWRPIGRGHLDTIAYRFIADEVTAEQALLAGEIDMLLGATRQQVAHALASDGTDRRVFVSAALGTPALTKVVWNVRRRQFRDRRVRLALALSTPRPQFVAAKFGPSASLVSGDQFHDGPAYDPHVAPVGYDPEAGVQLLIRAGWLDLDGDGVRERDGVRLSFEYLVPSGSAMGKDFAAVMQASLARAGVEVRVREVEWAVFAQRLRTHDFDALELGYAPSIEADPYPSWHSPDASGEATDNHSGFTAPSLDRLVERVRDTLDDAERQKLQWSVHRAIDREQPEMFLWAAKTQVLVRNGFDGLSWGRVFPGFDLSEWYVRPEGLAP